MTLIDVDIVKISYAGMNGSSMEQYIENKTDSAFKFEARYIAINGQSYGDIYVFETIAPNSKATIRMTVNEYSSSEDVNTIRGGFELYNVNNYFTNHNVEFKYVAIRI